ncbi:hypothetical protein CALCODRAFT_491746 [Calocera cornea HHB12733]|uniref:RBR-type E3 ubiquitin transferase n=1 Tax=Calocera cornea HHB12733 TaxID=1353952 RepID=A0A165IWZ4_9BASI|nr:hypothetical protein CALCODRAFT_491746 [Calocera cornea HHB12733]
MSQLDECVALFSEEWEAFKSIWPDSVTSPPEACAEGTRLHLDLPIDLVDDHVISLHYPARQQKPDGSVQPEEPHPPVTIRLAHLPPILLSFVLPSLYPLQSGPSHISLHSTHSWIPASAQSRILDALSGKWDAASGEGIIWSWAEWIRSGEFLIESGLREGNIIMLCHPAPDLLAPLLLQHDAASRNSEFAQSTYMCSICMTSQKGAQCLRLSRCGHVFCRTCLKDFWGLLIAEGDVGRVTCAEPECVKGHAEADEEDVRRACGEEALERWRWLREKRELEKDPTIIYCPLQVCQAPVPKPKMEEVSSGKENRWDALRTCPRCGLSFCAYCRRTWHGVLTRCVFAKAQAFVLEYQKAAEGSQARKAIEQRYGRANVLRLVAQHEEDEKNRAWLKQSTMPCPGCQVHVEKSFGCNHMTCSKCGCHYCFSCGEKVNAQNPYAHFNDLRNKCMLFDAKELREEQEDGWQPVEAFDILHEDGIDNVFVPPNWRRWEE